MTEFNLVQTLFMTLVGAAAAEVLFMLAERLGFADKKSTPLWQRVARLGVLAVSMTFGQFLAQRFGSWPVAAIGAGLFFGLCLLALPKLLKSAA